MNATRLVLHIALAMLVPLVTLAAEVVTSIEPTPLFPKSPDGQLLRQLVRLQVQNPDAPFDATVQVTLGNTATEPQPVTVPNGEGTVDFLVPDIDRPTPLTVELLAQDGRVLWSRKLEWQPQKKWTIYCCSYSHQDLGFGDYPHRLRTSIRHENIRLPLQFCRETDNRPEDSKYRFNIETSEPITSFISFFGKDAARELARRMREGRIALGRLHNTANTEQLSHELMARLFYMSGRYAVDLLEVPANKTMLNNDVIGLTWPLASYAAEADVPYFWHGYNGSGHCLQPAESEPVFYWNGPDDRGRPLTRSAPYGGYAGDSPGNGDEAHILTCIMKLGANWPYHALLLQEGTDFQLATRNVANQIHDWNAKWSHPRMVSATLEMFFDAIANQAQPDDIRAFSGDANNLWSDQDYAAARASAEARWLNASLPAAETLATVSQVLAGGNDQWINLFQGYHRLLQYWEHTNAKDSPRGNLAWYETELAENREMAEEACVYQQQVFRHAAGRLAGAIARSAEQNLIVFNPLPYPRTDIVFAEIPAESVVDAATCETLAVQTLPDGSAAFVAKDVPAIGYKVFTLNSGAADRRDGSGSIEPLPAVLESRYYKIQFHPATGAITSLWDKSLGVELVEKDAPHAFNEYLYEYRTRTTGLDFDSTWSRMEKADAVEVRRGAVADVLTIHGKAEGTRALRQTVILYHDLPRIDFAIWLDKAPFRGARLFPDQHEAVFIALPLAIPNFTIRHELPGGVIEPYRQQFQGSATGHYAIQGFTDLSGDRYGVTVSPIEGSLVCYGEPTSSPIAYGGEHHFKRDQTYPAQSRLYLYLLNNMFDVNIAAEQPGPVSFQWALRSHAGDWQSGNAPQFGRSVQQPLLAWRADGKNAGQLPSSASFMSVDAPNVMCSVIKPAEANGRGIIIRLNEMLGRDTTATVCLPLLPPIETAVATSLVEDDRTEKYEVTGNTLEVTLRKFGVKTIRVTCAAGPMAVSDLAAQAAADMQVNLRWQPEGSTLSHFNIYRDTQPDCPITQLNFIGQSAAGGFTDLPRIHLGGWLRSCLSPKTTYYYRVVPVDRANNPGTPSAVAEVTTLASEQANLPPVAVEALRTLLVSPISNDNFVNLLFRTACEPDVTGYEIHRGTQPGFAAGPETLVGVLKSDDLPPRSGGYGEQKKEYTVREYDHATFADTTVKSLTTYYYKVRALDTAGQKGAFSAEASVRTKDVFLRTSAQSIYGPLYDSGNAADGSPGPLAWVSKPYGGGTKETPLDVWWAIEFLKQPVTIKGVRIIGDPRQEIPLQRNLQVQIRENGQWRPAGAIKESATQDLTIAFAQPVATDALRVYVPAADLPQSPLRADTDGIVRICELKLLLPDDKEAWIEDVIQQQTAGKE